MKSVVSAIQYRTEDILMQRYLLNSEPLSTAALSSCRSVGRSLPPKMEIRQKLPDRKARHMELMENCDPNGQKACAVYDPSAIDLTV